jgi:phosphatidate phosphatase
MDVIWKKLKIKIILNITSISVVTIIALVFYLWVRPVQRGFYCNDMTIRYPFRESTINDSLLFALVLVPVLTIVPTIELFRCQNV